jgi:chorismate mutase
LEKILPLRKRIDEIDEQILLLLKERAHVCGEIGSLKKGIMMPLRDQAREDALIVHVRDEAVQLGLNASQVEAIFRVIISMCTRVQEESFKA